MQVQILVIALQELLIIVVHAQLAILPAKHVLVN